MHTMAQSRLDRVFFHVLNGVGILAVVIALGVVFNENLIAYQDCGDRAAGQTCSDTGTSVSLALVAIGGSAVLIVAFFLGRRRMAAGKKGFWFSLAALIAIALLASGATAVVAFATS
jgi:LPXTG-motif cell wall-anchored protein